VKKSATEQSQDNFQQELRDFASKDVKVIRKFLMETITGKRKDSQYDPKSGTIINKPIPIAVRVDATKAYEKFVMGRVVASKKDTQEVNVHHNIVDGAVKTVAERKQAEKKAAEEKARQSGVLAKKVVGAN
jgi:hypothetical protein